MGPKFSIFKSGVRIRKKFKKPKSFSVAKSYSVLLGSMAGGSTDSWISLIPYIVLDTWVVVTLRIVILNCQYKTCFWLDLDNLKRGNYKKKNHIWSSAWNRKENDKINTRKFFFYLAINILWMKIKLIVNKSNTW